MKNITLISKCKALHFDISQTAGKEIPTLGEKELKFSVDGFDDYMKALEKVAPVPVEFMDIASGAKGYFSPSEQKIALQKNMGESQTVKTAIHEIAHSLLHDKDNSRIEGLTDSDKKTRSTKEVEAESVAYTVCQHFGIDTSDYSFAYVAGWSSGKEMPELKESMDTIRKTASQLITGIEDALKEIQLERAATQEIGAEPVYEIWQLNNTPENRYLAFESMEHLKAAGLSVEKDNYDLIYTGKMDGMDLEDIYTKFNIDHPEDFRGHSLSVGDVVVIKDEEGTHAHYVDSFGYTDVPEFLNENSRAHLEENIKNAGTVTLVVSECSEYHALGECHENVKSTDEAANIFDSIPSERLNGIKSIGLSVPQSDYSENMEIDLLVGHTFDLDMLNYVPGIIENDIAMQMVAELINHYPEMQIKGEIPPIVSEKLECIHNSETLAEELSPSMLLASKIDEFMHDYDPYAYADQVADRDAQVQTIARDIESDGASYISMYLNEIVKQQEGTPENIENAKHLIEKLNEYKPLAKVEEQMEENYNHIDNILNNLKKPSEEKAENTVETDDKQEEVLDKADSESGRRINVENHSKNIDKKPSLKKRLEEKKEQVAEQPVKPAPEKTSVKTNGRGLSDE